MPFRLIKKQKGPGKLSFAQKVSDMIATSLLSCITQNPEICHSKPTIRNMRYPVAMILDLLSAGMTSEEIIADYPAIEMDDIFACLAYASWLSNMKSVHQFEA